jgi:hypothetical protein
MPQNYKVLSQTFPLAATLTDSYTVPAATSAVVSTLIVCNQSPIPTSFSVSIAVGGAADTPAQYLYADVPIPANDTFAATVGVTLAATDVVRVLSTLATCSFSLYGVENT